MGRKLYDGKDENIIIQKLEQCWAFGASDKEAASYAEISPAALSDFLKKNKKISERKEALLQKPFLLARESVISGIQADPKLALDYLKSKLPDEFVTKTKNEHTGKEGKDLIPEGAFNIIISEKESKMK